MDNAASNSTFISELALLLDSDVASKDLHFRCFSYILNFGAQDFLINLKLQTRADVEAETEEEIDENVDDVANDDDKDNNSDDEFKNNFCNDASPITKLKELFKKLKYSEKLREKLKCCCVTGGIKMLSPILDVKTR